MDRNVEMLNSIYQNATMARESIGTLLPKVDYPDLCSALSHQQTVYNDFANHASRLLYDYSSMPEDNNVLTKASAWTGIQLNSLIDSSPSHIAEMVIQGSTMGITDISKKLNDCYDYDKPVEGLGNNLLSYEQTAIEELKRFL